VALKWLQLALLSSLIRKWILFVGRKEHNSEKKKERIVYAPKKFYANPSLGGDAGGPCCEKKKNLILPSA